jgi:hypothetical protein
MLRECMSCGQIVENERIGFGSRIEELMGGGERKSNLGNVKLQAISKVTQSPEKRSGFLPSAEDKDREITIAFSLQDQTKALQVLESTHAIHVYSHSAIFSDSSPPLIMAFVSFPLMICGRRQLCSTVTLIRHQ